MLRRRRWRQPSAGQDRPPITTAELDSLLQDVRELRLTLSSDMAAAVGAVEADEAAVVRDILSSDRQELAAFRRRVRQSATPATGTEIQTAPRAAVRPASRRRALLALPVIPAVGAVAMTAAVAISGVTSGGTGAAEHGRQVTAAAAADQPRATLQRLEQLVAHHPSASQVLALTDQLHRQLAVLVAGAPMSTSRRTEARQLLTAEQQLLSGNPAPGAHSALVAARALVRTLLADPTGALRSPATEVVSIVPSLSAVPSETTAPHRHHRRASTSQRHHRRHVAAASHAPTASPSPSPSSPTPSPLTSLRPGDLRQLGS